MAEEYEGALLVYDVSKQNMTAEEIKDFITTQPMVIDWWNYMPGVYVLKLSPPLWHLTDRLSEKLVSYLATPTRLKSLMGKQPKEAWDKIFDDMFKDQLGETIAENDRREGIRKNLLLGRQQGG